MTMDKGCSDLLAELNALATGKREVYPNIETARLGSQFIWQRYAGQDHSQCHTEDIMIAERIPARLYRPGQDSDQALPLVIFFHGGGWSLGDIDSYNGFMRYLAHAGGLMVLSVGYRLAPENKFPAGLDDCTDAVLWAHGAIGKLGGDPQRMILAGDSAGGNLAMVIANTLRRKNAVPLAGLVLLYPVVDLHSPHEVYPSREQFGDGNFLISRSGFDLARDWYLQTPELAKDPRVSPLLSVDLHLLPPTLIITAGCDPLLDEGKACARLLKTAGVPVEYRCFDGAVHAFLSFGVLSICQEARQYLVEQIQRLLRP